MEIKNQAKSTCAFMSCCKIMIASHRADFTGKYFDHIKVRKEK